MSRNNYHYLADRTVYIVVGVAVIVSATVTSLATVELTRSHFQSKHDELLEQNNKLLEQNESSARQYASKLRQKSKELKSLMGENDSLHRDLVKIRMQREANELPGVLGKLIDGIERKQ